MYVPGPENYIAEGVINHNTGVGKGAQIAGIILDNWNQGRKKAVWISENARLFNDAQRDAEWVSLGKQRVFEQGKIKGEIGIKEGVAFTTYATLKSAERDKAGEKGKTRLDQLSDWLGKDFEGVIAFDEAHNMANAIARKGSRGVQQGSESARVGIELQKRFPKARVVYVSATGATEVHNLAYASRLGLWGEGTAFSNREAFIAAIHSGGLAAMEVVAKDTKSSGLYTARSLSYDGVEVETLQHELTTKQREMYDGMARAWQIVLRNVDAAMEAAQSNKNAQAKSSALSAFWGAHQRFFNAILTSLSAPSLIKDVQSHLDNEHSVVMQLVNTNEATMERRMAQAADTGQELEELDLTPRDILMQYLQNSFPTTLYEEYLDEEGNTKTRPVMDAAGNVVQSPQALAARDRLQEQLATLDVPEGILEQVINHFGSSQVAEITGRKRRLVRQKDGKVTEEKLGAAKTKVDAADFDQGKKRILIFSDAGGTGRSYHADLRIPNQQKRIHYLVQPGWRADKAIQGLGRTHRTNQKQPPLVKLVTTTLKSQKRFISSIARRMDQMGALTKGQRDANSQGIFDDDANLENEYSAMALNALFHDIARGKTDGITVADIEREMGLTVIDPKTGQVLEKSIPTVQRFLNRLLSLESDSMNRVFDAFDTRRRAVVEYAKQVGAYDAGMESLVAESIKKVEDVVAAQHPMGGETRYVKLEAEVKNKIIDFDMLRTAGIQFAKSVKTGKLYAFEEAESVTNPETGDLITRRRRVSTTSTSYVRETDLKNSDHYETVKFSDVGAMRTAWNDEIARTPKTRKETVHLISGALLPIWDRLPMSSNRVIRAQTDSGERLIGRVIKNNDLSATLRQLGVGVAAPKLDGKAALAAILDDHSTLVLSNGWRLMRRIVNGSPRVEVVPKEGRLSGGDRALLEDMGAFSEMVNWQFRTFLPTDNPGIVDRLFASKPLLEVVEPENRRSVPAASQSTGATVSQARAQLVAALNERSVAALERSGKLILHREDPTRTGAAGYVDPQGAIHLIPSNMDQDALAVALHEAMHLARDDRFSEGNRALLRLSHAALKLAGLKRFVDNPGFSNLAQQLNRMAAEGNKTAIEALDKARREAPGNVDDEALAYLVQYADEKLPIVRRIIAAIRAALYRMGVKVKLTPADVRALALSALKNQARQATNAVQMEAATQPEPSPGVRYSQPGRRQPLDSPRMASKVLGDIGEVRSTLKPGERVLAKADPRNWKQMLSDLSADTRPAWLGLLTRNMQLELAKEVLPAGPVAQFEKAAEQLDADESKMIQSEGFPLADRWQEMMRKDRAQADAVGRALYMSTWLSVDPRTKAPNGKQAEWIRAKAAYDALNPAAKQLYGDVLDFYQKQTDRMFMELDARIDRHSIPAPDKKAMRDQLRREFERVKQDGPYAPLMRFGDLTVFAEPRKAGDKPVFATFESVAEQRAFSDYLKREGYAPQLGVKMEEVVKRNLPQGDFVDDLAAAIDRTMSGPEAQIIKDSMYQLFLRSLPEQAIRKHFMHRKFVPGYSADALRTFATFARRSAKQVARLKHGDLMSDALNQMMKAVKSGTLQEPVAAGHLVNELDKTFQWAMAPTTAQWASKLTSLGFMWHLGASPAHLLLNLSQQAQVTAPWLAGELHGKMGFGSVASALLKANKDFIASNPFVDPAKRSATANKRRQALEAEFGGDLGRALTALEEAGKTDKTQTYSLAGLSEEDSFLWSKPYLRKAIQGAAWFFHTAEVVNREASAIAAYRLGRRSGLNHDQAYDLARRAINESHFDYSPSNRARYMRGNVAKVLTLFKQYSLNISWQLGRNAYLSARGQSPEVRAKARTKLLGMLGMTAVMAGAAGMPFYGEVMWMLTQLMNATRDDDEPEKDADLEFRRLLDFAFDPTASEAVRKGLINAFVGVDFSSRIKLDDLWWRSDNRDLSGRDAAYAAMEQALGPVAGLAVRGYSTIDELLAAMVYGENARGDSWRAMETSMPKMLKDISRSIRYTKEGATTYQGARILDPGELNTGAVVGQALGFAPAALADQYEINSAKMKIQTHILRQRRALLDTYAMARAQNDDEVKKAAIEDMRAFNKRYPTIAITRQTLLRSMTSRDRRKAEIEKSGGVALDRRLVDIL